MANKVLISFVGRGQFDKDPAAKKTGSGYLPTTYSFNVDGEEKTAEGHILMEAMLKVYDFSGIYLVGTNTSTWNMFIYDLAQTNESAKVLWDELRESCNGIGIEESQKERLCDILSEKYGVPVSVWTHAADIEESVVDEVFNVYNELAKDIPEKCDILFDITSGFRSMPLLAYQSLLYNSANENRRRIDIVYGQLNSEGVSYVRNLGRFWELSEGSLALKMFQEKYDSSLLASLCVSYSNELASLFAQFDNIVRFNLSYFVKPFIEGARQVLDDNPLKDEWPLWLQAAYIELEDVVGSVGTSELDSIVLKNFSKLMHEKGLLVQSIIALRCAFEAKCVENIDPSKVGNYDFWKDNEKKIFKKIEDFAEWLKNVMYGLGSLRNEVAHGGGSQKKSVVEKLSMVELDEKLSFEKLEERLKKCEKNLKLFFSYVDRGKVCFK